MITSNDDEYDFDNGDVVFLVNVRIPHLRIPH